MPVITMTHEMGARGHDISNGLAKALGLNLVDYQIVERHIADRMNIDPVAVHRYLEGGDNLLSRWRMHRQGVNQCTAQELFDLALWGNVLIRGWGATHLLRPVPHVISVRVCAPMEIRVANLMTRDGVSNKQQARREINGNDAAHARVLNHFSQTDWRDPLHYDLVLNTERLPVEHCIEQIIGVARLEAFQETPASRDTLMALQEQFLGPSGRSMQTSAHHLPEMDEPVLRENRDLL